MRMNNFLALVSGVALGLAAYGPASAQSNPSAQQLINQLAPTGSVSDTTRGIRPISPGGTMQGPGSQAPTAPASPMSAPQTVAAPSASSAPSANLVVDFESGSATLTPQATQALDQLGQALTSQQLAAYNFKIVGHTDTVGSPATNQALSEQRAAAVKSYLETKFGIADTRLQASGVGEADLAVATPANTPEPRNRRVEIVNLGQ
jgi:OOP family OmpA-OmpF porin